MFEYLDLKTYLRIHYLNKKYVKNIKKKTIFNKLLNNDNDKIYYDKYSIQFCLCVKDIQLLQNYLESINKLLPYNGFDDKFVLYCINHNLFDIFKLLYKYKIKISDNIFRIICSNSKLNFIKFAHQKQFQYMHYRSYYHDDYEPDYCNPSKDNKYILTYNCAKRGYLKGLKYLHQNGYNITNEVLKIAIQNKYFNCAKYILNNGININDNILLNIFYSMDIVKFLESKNIYLNESKYIEYLIFDNKIDIIEYLLNKYDIVLSSKCFLIIIEFDNKELVYKILNLLKKNKCILEERHKSIYIKYCIQNDLIEELYYFKNDLNEEYLIDVIKYNKIDILKYFIKNGIYNINKNDYIELLQTFHIDCFLLMDKYIDIQNESININFTKYNNWYIKDYYLNKNIFKTIDYLYSKNIILTFVNINNLYLNNNIHEIQHLYDLNLIKFNEINLYETLNNNQLIISKYIIEKGVKIPNDIINDLYDINHLDDLELFHFIKILFKNNKNIELNNIVNNLNIFIKNNKIKTFELIIELYKKQLKKSIINDYYFNALLYNNQYVIDILIRNKMFMNGNLYNYIDKLSELFDYQYNDYYYSRNIINYEYNSKLDFNENLDLYIKNELEDNKLLIQKICKNGKLIIPTKYKYILE